MLQFLLITLFAAIFVHDAYELQPVLALSPGGAAVTTLGGFAVLWLLFHSVAAACGRAIDRSGKLRAVYTAENVMTAVRVVGAAWWGVSVFIFGWLDAVRATVGDLVIIDELITLAPFVGLVMACWWSIFPMEERLQDAILQRRLDNGDGQPIHRPLTRWQYISSGLRHQVALILVPLALMLAWRESLNLKGEWLFDWLKRWSPRAATELFGAIDFLGTLFILFSAPALMRLVWSTVKIGPGPLRDRVRAMCRRHRVRVVGPLLWRTHGSLINGAILGVLWPLRFMLLTDALLERLPETQVEAVIAHEIAHVRRHHLPWLTVCIFASVTVLGWVVDAAGTLMLRHHASQWTILVVSAVALLGVAAIFGVVSRRFEWQADAFAAQHLSTAPQTPNFGAVADALAVSRNPLSTEDGRSEEPCVPDPFNPQSAIRNPKSLITPQAVSTMQAALQSVADLNGMDTTSFSWRHGSIFERQRRLASLVGVPVNKAPIDRQVLLIKIIASAALIASITPIIYGELIRWRA